MPDGITRAHRLRDLFDLTDPDYAFDLADLGPGHATINIRPKNPGSAGRPFGGSISFVVGKGSPEEAAIDDFMRYGRPVTIPSEFVAGVALDLPGNLGQLIPRMPARKSR